MAAAEPHAALAEGGVFVPLPGRVVSPDRTGTGHAEFVSFSFANPVIPRIRREWAGRRATMKHHWNGFRYTQPHLVITA